MLIDAVQRVPLPALLLIVLFVWTGSRQAMAQVYPEGFVEELVTDALTNPTAMVFTPDGRIFVCEQAGSVRVIKEGVLLEDPFLELTVHSTGERGLIGIAIDPDFEINQYVYIYYTVNTVPRHNRISRFTANGDAAVQGSETTILELDNLSNATNHNGGAMNFGPDDKLYVAIGDNATGGNAQNLDTYHGKFLRINKDGSIPTDNPFTDGSDKKKRIWAYGLRNPYTFDIQPGTGTIYVNDVGQNTWEEINDATNGNLNFGWPAEEGIPDNPGSEKPVFVYSHGAGDGKGCAITGGTFFNPSSTSYPGEYYGKYFFQDYCNGWIGYIDPSSETASRVPFATGLGTFCLGLITGKDGNLYYLSRSGKALYRIRYTLSTPPFITTEPMAVAAVEGQETLLKVEAIGSAPLQYQWYRDAEVIEGAIEPVLRILDTEPWDAGLYKVVVSNATGSAEGDVAMVTVTDVNDAPVVTINTPEHQSTYAVGAVLTFSGTGTDEEDGVLGPESFNWDITLRSDVQVYSRVSMQDIRSGEFLVHDEGITSSDVFYRIVLTAADSEGVVAKDSVEVIPRKVTITLHTDPEGMILLFDDQTVTTPYHIVSVVGTKRVIGVISPQAVGETEYNFHSWMHGGAETQPIVTPEEDATFTAVFSIVLAAGDAMEKGDMKVFPNPLLAGHKYAEVSIPSTGQAPVTIYLVDLLSRRVDKYEGLLTEGENKIPVDTALLRNGVYGIVVKVGTMEKTMKLLISR